MQQSSECELTNELLSKKKTELHFRTAATVVESGKARVIVVEARPNYAVVKLVGARKGYPISWEQIFHIAEKNHAENLRLEENAAKQLVQEAKERNRQKEGREASVLKATNRADPFHSKRNGKRESR